MTLSQVGTLAVAALWLALAVALLWRLKRRRSHLGAGAAGAVYDMLNEDKRKAVELIVEEKTGERDPERAMGRGQSGVP
jgi:hypothetical protein